MDEKIENVEDIVKHWLDSAEQNYITMQHLIDAKDYSWALFLGHLVIEKTLKANLCCQIPKACNFYPRFIEVGK